MDKITGEYIKLLYKQNLKEDNPFIEQYGDEIEFAFDELSIAIENGKKLFLITDLKFDYVIIAEKAYYERLAKRRKRRTFIEWLYGLEITDGMFDHPPRRPSFVDILVCDIFKAIGLDVFEVYNSIYVNLAKLKKEGLSKEYCPSGYVIDCDILGYKIKKGEN